MRILPLVAACAFLFSGCAVVEYDASDLEAAIQSTLTQTEPSKNAIYSNYGDHPIELTWHDANILAIHGKQVTWKLVGNASINNAPYETYPKVSAIVTSTYSWNDNNQLMLTLDRVKEVSLEGISMFHLRGIRKKVKDVIALNTLNLESLILREVELRQDRETRIKEMP